MRASLAGRHQHKSERDEVCDARPNQQAASALDLPFFWKVASLVVSERPFPLGPENRTNRSLSHTAASMGVAWRQGQVSPVRTCLFRFGFPQFKMGFSAIRSLQGCLQVSRHARRPNGPRTAPMTHRRTRSVKRSPSGGSRPRDGEPPRLT